MLFLLFISFYTYSFALLRCYCHRCNGSLYPIGQAELSGRNILRFQNVKNQAREYMLLFSLCQGRID